MPYRIGSVLIGFFSILFAVSLAVAEKPAAEPPAAASPAIIVSRPLTQSESFNNTFYQAINSLNVSQVAEASELLIDLRRQADAAGYANLPEFSFTLIERARSAMDSGDPVSARYLVRRAVALSPEDGQVLLSAASFHEMLGWGAAASYFWKGLPKIVNHPSALVSLGVNVSLVLLTALTLSLFLVCIVQLAAHTTPLYSINAQFIPRKRRQVFGPVLFLALLVLPLFGGVLFAVACWSLLLCRSLLHARWFGVFTGALILCWAMSIPVLERLRSNSDAVVQIAVEQMNSASFAAGAHEVLEEALKKKSSDALLHFAIAQSHFRRSDLVASEREFNTALKIAGPETDIGDASLMNLGAVRFNQKDYEGAKMAFLSAEKKGIQPFTVYYNLAQTHMALLDTEGHRKYFALAKDENEKSAMAAAEHEEQGSTVFLFTLSSSTYLGRFLNPTDVSGGVGDKLAGSLLVFSSVHVLMAFGALVLVLGALSAMKVKRLERISRRKDVQDGLHEPSSIWLLMPAGTDISGCSPMRGLFTLTVLIALVMSAMQQPVVLIDVVPRALPYRDVFFALSAVMLCASLVSSSVMFAVARRTAEVGEV